MKDKLKEIFDQYYSPLCNYATKIISDNVAAEDIVQNVFVQLWENNQLETIENYENYLIRATKYKCIDYIRKEKKYSTLSLDKTNHIIADEDNYILEDDIEPLFYYYVSKLPHKTKEVFLLSRKSGLTYQEIAESLDISIKTVENQMGRALRILRKLLKENDILFILLYVEFLK